MLDTALNSLFTLVIVAAALAACANFWQWFYAGPTGQDETVFFRTVDGWRLAVHHYRPAGEIRGLPVILCHGLSANRYVFDLPDGSSLARFLRGRGRDVWVVELRGSGMSDCPALRASDVPYSWGFEDHLRRDVPAAIRCVLERTGADAAHWVGHSMGGMLILAHLASSPDSPIASAVAVGSPINFSQVGSPLVVGLLKIKKVLEFLTIFPVPFLGKTVAPLAYHLPGVLLGLFYQPNLQPAVARRILAVISQIVSPSSLWLEFGRFLEDGQFGPSRDRSYLDGLEASAVPILVAAGSKDLVAPPAAVVPSDDFTENGQRRAFVTFGKAFGCREDYGHVDLLLGARVEAEVYPRILAWIDEHEPAAS